MSSFQMKTGSLHRKKKLLLFSHGILERHKVGKLMKYFVRNRLTEKISQIVFGNRFEILC